LYETPILLSSYDCNSSLFQYYGGYYPHYHAEWNLMEKMGLVYSTLVFSILSRSHAFYAFLASASVIRNNKDRWTIT
jgi:hypothetical protein